MWKLKNREEQFDTLQKMLDWVLEEGACPSAKVLKTNVNGNWIETGERVSDFLQC